MRSSREVLISSPALQPRSRRSSKPLNLKLRVPGHDSTSSFGCPILGASLLLRLEPALSLVEGVGGYEPKPAHCSVGHYHKLVQSSTTLPVSPDIIA